MRVQTLIVGGGAAGLWLLDALRRAGVHAVLIDRDGLGHGQTIASQGIIHGGIKYSLIGSVTGSAKAIRRMPEFWRQSLAGQAQPDLSRTRLRSDHCHLWHTASLGSRLGLGGARKALRITPTPLDEAERPAVFKQVRGKVLRLDEQVICPRSFLQSLADRNSGRVLSCAPPIEIDWQMGRHAVVQAVTLRDARTAKQLVIEPQHVVLTAGQGNDELRWQAGLDGSAPGSIRDGKGQQTSTMQRRPLHMVVARGALPRLNGHCIDGQKTRVTITSQASKQMPTDAEAESNEAASNESALGPEPTIKADAQVQDNPAVDASGAAAAGSTGAGANSVVWQIGGQIAEAGVSMDAGPLIEHAKAEIAAVLPGVALTDVAWTTYRVDRAEAKMPTGVRPENVWARREGNVITAWPTKLALVPELSRVIGAMVQPEGRPSNGCPSNPNPEVEIDWPHAQVSAYPWEGAGQWVSS